MNTRRLTKKYKHKSRSRNKSRKTRKSRRRGKTRRRVLKGGTFEIEKQKFLDDFFNGLKHNNFIDALCALHTFYTCGIDLSHINEVISSEEFKREYAKTFFKEVKIPNSSGGHIINIESKYKLIAFLSYIFKKIAEGETIICDDGTTNVQLYFTPGTDSFLKILKNFFGYLDTACVLTISSSISKTQLDEKNKGGAVLSEICKNLKLLAKTYPTMKSDIDELLGLMTTGTGEKKVYSFNTTNMCTLIKMTQQLFTYFD